MATNGRPLILMSLEAPMEVTSSGAVVTLGSYQTVLIAAGSQWCTVRAGRDAAPFMFVTPPTNRDLLAARLIAAGIAQEQIDRFMEQF